MPFVNLHLVSSPGRGDISAVVEASRANLEEKDNPVFAEMPLASLYTERRLRQNVEAFMGLARLQMINIEVMRQKEIEDILRDAPLAYLPGGNTPLLYHRVNISGISLFQRKKFRRGHPWLDSAPAPSPVGRIS